MILTVISYSENKYGKMTGGLHGRTKTFYLSATRIEMTGNNAFFYFYYYFKAQAGL